MQTANVPAAIGPLNLSYCYADRMPDSDMQARIYFAWALPW